MFLFFVVVAKILYTGDFSRVEDRHLMAAELPTVKPDVLIIVSASEHFGDYFDNKLMKIERHKGINVRRQLARASRGARKTLHGHGAKHSDARWQVSHSGVRSRPSPRVAPHSRYTS